MALKERKSLTLLGLLGAGDGVSFVFCDGDEAGGVVGNAPGIIEPGLEKYASLLNGLFCRSTGLRFGVTGWVICGSLGGGTGGNAAKLGEIGGGDRIEVPLAKESVEGGKGGNLNDDEEGRWYDEEEGRLLSPDEREVFDEALKDGR